MFDIAMIDLVGIAIDKAVIRLRLGWHCACDWLKFSNVYLGSETHFAELTNNTNVDGIYELEVCPIVTCAVFANKALPGTSCYPRHFTLGEFLLSCWRKLLDAEQGS